MRVIRLLGFLLIVGVALFGISNALTLAPATVAGVWPIRAGPVSLSVNARSSNAFVAGAIDFDPDGAFSVVYGDTLNPTVTGDTPTVHVGVGSIRVVKVAPKAVDDYYAYLYELDVDFKTLSYSIPGTIFYEAREAACTGTFAVVIDAGSLGGSNASTESVQISDVWVEAYASGVTLNPAASWEEVKARYDAGSFPEKNILPYVVPSTQGGEPCITEGAGTTTATCRVSVSLRAGGFYQWSYTIFGTPWAQTVAVDNVYARYLVRIEVLVPKGQAPPGANPWDIFIQMLRDFGFWVRDSWQNLQAALGLWLWVLLAVGLIMLIFIIRPILVGRYGRGGTKSKKSTKRR
jgi:hypothetical protein